MSNKSFYHTLPISKHWASVSNKKLSRLQKGKIAEEAVSFRCVLHGFSLFVSPFDGDKADRVIGTPSGKLLTLQIRWCKRNSHGGSPTIRLTSVGNNKVVRHPEEGDFDFLIGYDLRTDTAFVFSWEEVKSYRTDISVSESAMEAWSKLS